MATSKRLKLAHPVNKDWYFTFAHNHDYPNNYVKINGTYDGAKGEMNRRFGTKWADQYASAKFAGVDKFNLTEIK